ncbi:MAG: PEGA domain-containing protein [Bacteroidales bacterium]
MALNATSLDREDEPEGGRAAAARTGPGLFAWYAQGFSDPLGDRLLLFDNTSGAPLELLRLRAELSQVPGFEAAARDRAAVLAAFEAPHYARVCRVDRLPEPGGGLAVVSEGNQGQRLSEILQLAEQRHLQPGGDIVRRLVGEIVQAVADFHAVGPDIVHGALSPQRLVVSPDGQLLVTEYVLGSALARVPLDRLAFWTKLRLALPADTSIALFDQRTDVIQLGTIALALVLGRMLREDEYPARLTHLVAEAHDRLVLGGWGPLVDPFHGWLLRMLQMDAARPLANGIEARDALAELAGTDQPAGGDTAVEEFARTVRRPAVIPAADATDSMESAAALPDPTPEAAIEGASIAESRALPAVDDVLDLDDEDELEPIPFRQPFPAPRPAPAAEPIVTSNWKRYAIIALVVVAIAEGLFIGGRLLLNRGSAGGATGAVNIDSEPSQATVVVDGKLAGVTPIKLQLAPGPHAIELSAGERRRTLSVTTSPGSAAFHHVELPQAQAAAKTGKLRVVTSPVGGRVLVDGKAVGVSPLVVDGLAPGKHEVVIENRQGNVRQSVDIEQSATASLFIPLPGGGTPAPGWLTIASPVEVSVYENDEMVGTSKSARIMLPAGRHEVQLVAESVGFRATRQVDVPAGRTANLDVSMPNGRVDANALPWAEVLIDNRRIGETPLAGIPVPAGRHLVTFRHPQLGERTVECLVTLQAPARVSVDLRK